MEEQRQRQEDEARRSTGQPAAEPTATPVTAAPSNDDAMLERALAMSMDQPSSNVTVASAAPAAAPVYPDFATMTEEEQIAYAMQMSMQESSKSFFTTKKSQKKKRLLRWVFFFFFICLLSNELDLFLIIGFDWILSF